MIGVVLLNMGGPDSLEAVRPFLYNLFSDREIIRLGPPFLQRPIAWWIARTRAPKSRLAYEKIGGRSPLEALTRVQAQGAERLLNAQGGEAVVCRPGMRYWRPWTSEVLAEFKRQGVQRVLGVSLYPHYSRTTSGSSLRDFERQARALGMDFATVDSFPDHPLYVSALAETVREGLESVEQETGSIDGGKAPDFALIYSAHSLPKRVIDEGDPYVDHLHRTISAVEKITGVAGRLCFQSRSGPVEWLAPATDHMLLDLAAQGKKRIFAVPISFVSDHVETLFEIDMLYWGMMHERGVRLFRSPSLNDRPAFLRALTDLIETRLKEVSWRGSS